MECGISEAETIGFSVRARRCVFENPVLLGIIRGPEVSVNGEQDHKKVFRGQQVTAVEVCAVQCVTASMGVKGTFSLSFRQLRAHRLPRGYRDHSFGIRLMCNP
jgi:hypothetical protein